MNRIRYKPKIFTALILSLILGLSTCVSSIGMYTVYASDWNDNDHGDTDRAYGYQKGGLSESKGGAIISLRDNNGNPVLPTLLNILATRNRESGNLEIGVPVLGNRLFVLDYVSISIGILVKALPHLRCVAAFTNISVENIIRYAQK